MIKIKRLNKPKELTEELKLKLTNIPDKKIGKNRYIFLLEQDIT